MALKRETDTAELTVPGKDGKFSYAFEVLSGDFEDALAHAGNDQTKLSDAYFDVVNTKAKASARQSEYNKQIDPEEKAKADAIRNLMTAFGWSREKAQGELVRMATEGNQS